MVLNKDFSEFVALLNERNVKYLVIGGYAVAYHGYPRYTKDLDIWVWLDPENAEKTATLIRDFGMGYLDISPEDLKNPGTVVQIGLPPNRIDLLTDLEGLDFETCFSKCQIADVGGLPIKFIDFESLIIAKLNAGRPQDRVDVRKLRERLSKIERKKK